ncbi:MAG: MBL fold metallo-hydrolase [Lachnospiraceae bacterium]|nr:MBL fold metallo-hydrolase [Lachnospiraceae bacterium]
MIGLLLLVISGCGLPGKKPEGWTITQYGNPDGNQLMCYTIEDKNKNLAIIDGGYDVDADALREIIKQHGNHVSAWVVTHPHPDHAGAFNAIMAEPGEIQVDVVYTVEVHHDRYQETAQEYDRFDVYETFLRLTENMENLKYVYEDDEFDLLGLHAKVLHTWDDNTDELDVNLCNNGSMMFVLSGEKEKMLFCADVENEMEGFIMERHMDELNVDYVQTGHHGNWGPTLEFYDCMSPKGVFMDAPNVLIETTDAAYDAHILKDYFEKKGADVYSFSTAPNAITIH